MDPLALLGLILFLAFIVETLVEAIFSPIFTNILLLQPYRWALMYIALVVGIVGAFIYQLDLIYLAGVWLKVPGELVTVTWFGKLLTGLAVGKGSNYIHELIKMILAPKPNPGA